MFKEGDIVNFNNGEDGIMKILPSTSLTVENGVIVSFIANHEFANNGIKYIVYKDFLELNCSYERNKKLEKLRKWKM